MTKGEKRKRGVNQSRDSGGSPDGIHIEFSNQRYGNQRCSDCCHDRSKHDAICSKIFPFSFCRKSTPDTTGPGRPGAFSRLSKHPEGYGVPAGQTHAVISANQAGFFASPDIESKRKAIRPRANSARVTGIKNAFRNVKSAPECSLTSLKTR